ncbi:OmpA family protein [Lutibacter sp. TH_r2]|uniref:OmpA family protein n=1 Tax=Lutibacter sp. TH_r2 TaxID=3082083 RepID=UPI0029551B20|nr:OmpA family protein [Lutibacter sp. TH_r2]MDV7186472.1 OmpA family protein [Lutibacter sp. TH_r2]
MKQFKIIFAAFFLLIAINNTYAQDNNNPWQIGFGVNAVDFYPTNASPSTDLTTLHGSTVWYDEFFNADDHYNMIPAITRLSVGRYITKGFSFEAVGSLNKIEHIGDNSASDLSYYGLDGTLKYDINNIVGETGWFDPYLAVGGGYTWMDNWGTGTVNGGVGANIWFNDNIGLNIETKYKHTFDSSIIQHFQHSAGIVIKFGGTDTDGDGIYDKNDACPDVFGLEEFNGCPDSDNDGIIDSEDACPEIAGLAELNGCPDADADGIADKDDACPNAKGTKANNGCPDTDGDGVVDKDDACPKVVGPKENKGCPWPDTDNDGVADKDDKCINEAGPASNNGCPEKAAEVLKAIEGVFQTVYFNIGSSAIKSEGVTKLDAVVEIMNKYSEIKTSIASGYADSTGSTKFNQKLSEKRANAVKEYLISKGVSTDRISTEAFGEANPAAANNTSKGRALNRRVEVKLVD